MSKLDEKIKKLRDTIAAKKSKARKARRTRNAAAPGNETESTKG